MKKIVLQEKIQQSLELLLRWFQPRREQIAVWAAPRLTALQGRWQSFNTREKYSVLTGASLIGIFLFYVLIWSPLNSHLADLRTEILREKKTAAWMQAADQTLRTVDSKQSKLSAKRLSQRINLVQEDLRQAPLHENITQLTQSAPNEIRCVFDRVDFDTFVPWLMMFSEERNLTIKQATVRRLNQVGLVQVELVLQV